MSTIVSLTDATLDETLNNGKPVVLLLTNGDGLRGDFNAAFKKAADEHSDIVFAKLNPEDNPQAAARFQAGSKPMMVVWHNGEVVARRSRPWGSDIALVLDQLKRALAEQQSTDSPIQTEKEETTMTNANNNAPVTVTDDTFQQEVIDYSANTPVLVDFWAEWCGPCRMVAPILDKLAQEFGDKVRIAKVNVDENPGLAQYFQIMSIPTMMAIKERTIVYNQPGALPEPALRELITKLIELEVPKQEEPNTTNN